MNFLKLPFASLLIISIALAVPVAGQKRRAPEKTPTKSPAAPAPPTFDTLIAADSFKICGEVRGVGQILRSSAANDLLEPILKLGGPSKEFRTFVNWLKLHSDQLITSRLLVAAWPTFKEVPDVVVAIEFSSAEEAAKFESQLNGPLSGILPPTTPDPAPEANKKPEQQQQTANEKPREPPTPVPSFHLKRFDSLLLISSQPVQLKKLRPPGSKPLSEDPNFRVAYNRFSSEPIFVFVDLQALEKEDQEREKKWEEERKKTEEAQKALQEQQKENEKTEDEQEAGDDEGEMTAELRAGVVVQPSPEEPKEPSEAELLGGAVSAIQYSLFMGQPHLPDAIGIGFLPENDSFEVRVLMIDAPGETSDPVPIFSGLTIGPAIAPTSPNVLPADSELVLIMSLDLPQIHARISAPDLTVPVYTLARGNQAGALPPQVTGPMAMIEKTLKINTRDELLPLLGSEVAVGMPMTSFNLFGLARPSPGPQPKESADGPKAEPRTPFVVLSLRDREGMRRLMPKLLEGFAGKAAAALAQTERREDTELVSFGNIFAYALIGDFLVLSGNAATTRYVVDSYLKHQTLASDMQFKNFTRWQPRQVQGQVYVSPAFMESYKTWANNPNSHLTDESRAFFARLSAVAQPVTYSLSNDGLGSLHELHVPKNVILLAVAGIAAADNPPPTFKNERMAMGVMWSIAGAEHTYRTENASAYASLEQLITANKLSKDMIESSGYKFEVTVTADGYEITAVPMEYGKTGKLSLFMDQTGVMRGADHNGAAASASDAPIN